MKTMKWLFVSSFLTLSCSSSHSPTNPSKGGFTLTAPVLEATLSGSNGSNTAQAILCNAAGPVTDASVTLSSGGGSTTLTYNGNASAAVTYNGAVSVFSMGVYRAYSGWTYTASQAYTITAAFGGVTYTSAVTAVGAVTFQTGTSGVTCSWSGGVTSTSANPLDETNASATENISPYNVYFYPANLQAPFLDPPLVIPASSLSAYSPGTYIIQVYPTTLVTNAFPGAFAASFISAFDQEHITY